MNSAITFNIEKIVEFEKEIKNYNKEIKKLEKRKQLSNEKTWENGCSTRQIRTIF